jgi:hypothetical protein
MTNITKAGHGHGAQFDRFPQQARNPHGPQSDENYGRKGRNPHGPQSDDSYGNGDDRFERELKAVPASVRNMAAGCPGCGHQHTLEAAVRAGRRPTASKSSHSNIDVRKSVRDSDEAAIRSGVGEPDELHQALAASVRKTYGRRLNANGRLVG